MVLVRIYRTWNGDEPPQQCPKDNCEGSMKSWACSKYDPGHVFQCTDCGVFLNWIPDYLGSDH